MLRCYIISAWVTQQQLNPRGIAYTVRVYTAGIFIHSDVCDILYRYSMTIGICMPHHHYSYCMGVAGVSGCERVINIYSKHQEAVATLVSWAPKASLACLALMNYLLMPCP
jgi:hypothetical protein